MAVRNVVALQYGFVSCTFCRNLYFVKLFSKLERSFAPSRNAIFLLSFAIRNCAWRFNSSCVASSLRVALQIKSSCGASSLRVGLRVLVVRCGNIGSNEQQLET